MGRIDKTTISKAIFGDIKYLYDGAYFVKKFQNSGDT